MADSGNVVSRHGDKIFLVVAVALLITSSLSYLDADIVPKEQQTLINTATQARNRVEKSWREQEKLKAHRPEEYDIKDTVPFQPVKKDISFFNRPSFLPPEQKALYGNLHTPRLFAQEGGGGDEVALSVSMKYKSGTSKVLHPDKGKISFEIQRAQSTNGTAPPASAFKALKTVRAARAKGVSGARKGEPLKTGTTYYYRARALATYSLGEAEPKEHQSKWSSIVSREIKDVFKLAFKGIGGFDRKIKIAITDRVKGRLLTMPWRGRLGERVGSGNPAILNAGLAKSAANFVVTDVVHVEFILEYTDRVVRIRGMKISSYARTLKRERDVTKNADVVRNDFGSRFRLTPKTLPDVVFREDRGDIVGEAFNAFRKMHKSINVKEIGFDSGEGLLDDQERGVLMKALREAAKRFKGKIMHDLTTRKLRRIVQKADCPHNHQKTPLTPVVLSNPTEGQDWVAYYCPAGKEYYVYAISENDSFFTGSHALKKTPKNDRDLKAILDERVDADMVSRHKRMIAGAPVFRKPPGDRVQVAKKQEGKYTKRAGNEIVFAIVTRRDEKGKLTIIELPRIRSVPKNE